MIAAKILWGSIHFPTGMWMPNPKLAMTAEQQREENIKNGHVCLCGYHVFSCKCKNIGAGDG